MHKRLLWTLGLICLLLPKSRAGTDADSLEAWTKLKTQPVTEDNFRQVCDLIQDVGRNNINDSYKILGEYLPVVQKTGNRWYAHVLLMNWARAKESFQNFAEAEGLYQQARANARENPQLYDEALVGTVLLYAEWGKIDSLDKYVSIGKASAEKAKDNENLSFIYTFSTIKYLTDTAQMGQAFRKAIALAENLPNKNALFTARYNYANVYAQNNPQLQVMELNALLELSADSTFSHKPKLYERTNFYFRNPVPSIYSQLMQVNLLLTDYDNAWKFGELLYNAVIKPNPSSSQAPYFYSELAMVKAWQGDIVKAKDFLGQSRDGFKVPENQIAYPSYFLAAGLIAEQEQKPQQALDSYEKAYKMGTSEGLHLIPIELYYAHGLILNNRLDDAAKVFQQLTPALKARMYSAYGFYFYKYNAELLKAKRDYPGYAKALETYYGIRDSLINFNHYQTIQEIQTRVRLKDKEQQITLLNEENVRKQQDIRRDRILFVIFLSLGLIIILLLAGFIRNRVRQMQKQHRIDVMQGALDAEENERRNIADQLHDEVGSMLSLATLNVTSALEHATEKPPPLEKNGAPLESANEIRLAKTRDILASVSVTIRELSHRLTPKDGLRKAVEDMLETVNLSGKLKITTIIVGFEESNHPLTLDIYRILQELLQNILKHAHATEALFELVEHPDHVSIMVEDNGIGIPEQQVKNAAAAAAAGKGLIDIQRKINYLNGHIDITRKQEGGTLITINLPVKT